MLPVARYLPNAYLRPLPSELPKTEPLGSPQTQNNTNTDRVIEAEWRPISGSPARAAKVYYANAAAFTEGAASTLNEMQSPSLVAERYQQMTPRPNLQRGTILDIRV